MRLPVRYTQGGEDNLRHLQRLYAATEPDLLARLEEELERGFPVDHPAVRVDLHGEVQWGITHPDLDDDTPLELDLPEETGTDVDPIGFKVFGQIDYVIQAGAEYPGARFVCAGIRELRREYRV